MLKRVGLTSITIGVETPDQTKLRAYHRTAISDDRQCDFIALCRGMGIRTVAGFLIGFPGDTEQSIRDVEAYAKMLNPTFANFNIVTPYPGTEFYEQSKDRLLGKPFEHYTVYRPVMRCDHLTTEQLQHRHTKCFLHFYFRWQYLRDNAHLLWPSLQRLGLGREVPQPSTTELPHHKLHLRHDGPHDRPRTSDETSDRKNVE